MKPGRWWRAQCACVDNAKLIKLSDKAHRNWFNLNCVANEHGGILPDIQTISIKLRVSEARAAVAIAELVAAKLFEKRSDGSFVPHDWEQWQYKSDLADSTNAERQKRLRARRRDELNELRALRDHVRNTPLRNAVRPLLQNAQNTEAEITTTVSGDTGHDGSLATALSDSALREPSTETARKLAISPQLAAIIARKQIA